MRTPGLITNYVAETILAACRIVCFGATDGSVKQSTAATDKSVGVTEGFTYAAGDRLDVVRTGLAEVEYGGTVTRGDLLTSDASGRAITAAPGAGTNHRIVGIAEVSGVVGDIGSMLIVPQTQQG